MLVLVWMWIILFRLPQHVAATDSISRQDESNSPFSDPPKQIAFTVCIVASIAGVLAVGVYAIVARKRRKWFRKASDDPELGSAAAGSNDDLLPSDQPANSESPSRAPYDPLTWAQLTRIPVPDADASKRRSRHRRSRLVMVYTSLEPIPEHEQWQFCSSSDDDEDETSPFPDSFHDWYQNRRHRKNSARIPKTAGHTKNPEEEPPESPSHEEEGAAGLRDIVDLSSRHARRVHLTSRALKQKGGPTRHHDTGPRDWTSINKRSTHLVQFLAPILLQETEPSVTEQQAETAAVSAAARAA